MAGKKKAVSIRIDVELLDEMNRWIAAQAVRPSKTAVVEAALRDLMNRNPVKLPKKT